MTPAVFLDKDGTLVEDVPYNVDPDRIVLTPGARDAAVALSAAGYLLVVVTNQSGVARGLFGEDALSPVEHRLGELLGVSLAGFYACPHHPGGSVPAFAIDCTCRKPQPGMLRRAARDLNIDLAASWMVGDILNDVEAGRAAGCRTILIDNNNETEWIEGPLRTPHLWASGMAEAAHAIIAQKRNAA